MDTEKGKIVYSLDKSIFYRNQFIFHDSKAALTWLMNNDRNFLRDLFLEYGYDKSDVINKMMLDESRWLTEFLRLMKPRHSLLQEAPMGNCLFIEDCWSIC